MCSHSDGSLSTWNIKDPKKPAAVLLPHGEYNLKHLFFVSFVILVCCCSSLGIPRKFPEFAVNYPLGGKGTGRSPGHQTGGLRREE